MSIQPENAEYVIMAACCIHNFLRIRQPQESKKKADTEHPYTHDIIPGRWRAEIDLPNLHGIPYRRPTNTAKQQREFLAKYFTSEEGAIPWQHLKI